MRPVAPRIEGADEITIAEEQHELANVTPCLSADDKRHGWPTKAVLPGERPMRALASRYSPSDLSYIVVGKRCAAIVFPASRTRLLLPRSPSAVFRSIGPVVIDSVDRMLIAGPQSHVSEEVLKTLSPSLAHDNSSTAVLRPGPHPRIAAPILHRLPRSVFHRSCARRAGTVPGGSGFPSFTSEASARERLSRHERPTRDNDASAAITPTQPLRLTVPVRSVAQLDEKSPKPKAGQIPRVVRHDRNITTMVVRA